MYSTENNITLLLNRIEKHDDEKAFATLYDTYHSWLRSVARMIVTHEEDAEEVIHDVFVKLWMKRKRLSEIDNIETYLYTAAKNTAYNRHRKRTNERFIPLDEGFDLKSPNTSPEQVYLANELAEVCRRAIEKLPEKCREIFRLVREQGYSHKKVAEKMNITPKTIANQLTTAAKRIALDLEAYLEHKTPHSKPKKED